VTGFVDIHSHVLYGLDDGASTREDSLAMLDLAARSGTTDIVATPHANGRYAFDPDAIAQRIAELGAESPVRIHPGCDFHLQADNISDALAHPEKYTINHKGYLLVEFPDVSIFSEPAGVFARLLDAGMVPIVTHPERNALLRDRLDDLARWVEAGCYLQVTAASYTGLFGRAAKATAYELLERGLTHFVASDAHDTQRRTTSLVAAYTTLADAYGEEAIRPLFVENPRAVLEGATVDVDVSPRRGARRKWYQFWR
jgi:protein-tyrosine phosphatase